jgi:hypothetical protein
MTSAASPGPSRPRQGGNTKVEFDDAQKLVLDEMLLNLPGAKAGKMFGLPGYWTGGKLFACLFGPGVGLKLPPARQVAQSERSGYNDRA